MLRFVFHRDDVRQEGRRTEIVESGCFGPPGGLQDRGSSAATVASAPCWPVTPRRIAGLDEVHREGLQPGGERGFQRDPMRAEDRAGGDQ